jgi:hypothetical protein
MQTNDYIARVEQEVRKSLRGAQVYALVLVEESIIANQGRRWERIYVVAWERADQCGTHRVNIHSDGRSACFMGHYDMSKEDAYADMLKRVA